MSNPIIGWSVRHYVALAVVVALAMFIIAYSLGHHAGYHQGICDLASSIAGKDIVDQVCP